MLLYIIRHGDPIYDPDSLTEKGKQQAQALARRLSVHGLDKIFSSPMIRAQQTAQPTCDLLKLDKEILDWTSEQALWDETAITLEDGRSEWCFHLPEAFVKKPEMLTWGDAWPDQEPYCRGPKTREGYARVCRESDAFTERLGYRREGMMYRPIRPNDDRIAVFCHQGFGTTWLSHLLAIPAPLYWASFDLSHSSITILHFKNTTEGLVAPMCITSSDTSHIYADRLPLQFCNTIDI